MATITIKDLHTDKSLDHKAMSAIKGGNGSWVFGWIQPYRHNQNPFGGGAVINFYQINNYADQMINQNQIVNVNNTGSNSNVNVDVSETSTNVKH